MTSFPIKLGKAGAGSVIGMPITAGIQRLRVVLAVSATALCLSACGTVQKPEPVLQTVEVDKPVYRACTATIPDKPAWADSPEARKASPDVATDLNIRDAGIVQRDAYIGNLTTALAACIQVPPTSKLAGSP